MLAVGIFVLPLALYIKTLAPNYIPIDSAEFALCAHFWGVCHPPGFPLYVIVAKIFSGIFPFGALIYKVNLLSAIFGATTILLVFLTLVELKVSRVIAFLTCLFLAIVQPFWEFSLAADVFTFSTFLLILIFFFTFKKWRFLAFFTLGLSASHFYISAVLWPLLCWYFLADKYNGSETTNESNWQRAKFILLAGLLFTLGFFPQALMYWRMQQNPEINWGHAQRIAGFINFVRRREFGSIFLISNPVLKFSLVKLLHQFYVYITTMIINFGVILPIVTAASLTFLGLVGKRRVRLLIFSYLVIVLVQLTLLSTIDPLEKNNPFQLNKFYLSSYIPLILLIGIGLERLNRQLFAKRTFEVSLVLAFLILIYILSNFRINNYSGNYFSQNMVLDGLNELPQNSVAITVSHIFYFGGLYEQKINGKYAGIDLVYFPNENNRDGEFYKPWLFSKEPDTKFVENVKRGKNLGRAEEYVLQTIARNQDKQIFILQGAFEENFFSYLKPYIRPYGLWWRVEKDAVKQASIDESLAQFSKLKNQGFTVDSFNLKQQKDDLLTYAVSYNSMGVVLASVGRYDEANTYFNKSLEVNPDAQNIKGEIDLVEKTKQAYSNKDLINNKDEDKIIELGNNLFTLGNYQGCIEVFGALVDFAKERARAFNNLASCQASIGKIDEARANYQKALSIDANLDLAKKGLENLGK